MEGLENIWDRGVEGLENILDRVWDLEEYLVQVCGMLEYILNRGVEGVKNILDKSGGCVIY